MDLRKGSGMPEGKRRCIRCRGRKKLYKTMSGWCFDNSGGVLQNCPMCRGDGFIDNIKLEDIATPAEIALGCAIADLEEKEIEQKAKRSGKKSKKFQKEY